MKNFMVFSDAQQVIGRRWSKGPLPEQVRTLLLARDALSFIHATGHSMTVMIESLAVAEERIRLGSYGPISAVKRLG